MQIQVSKNEALALNVQAIIYELTSIEPDDLSRLDDDRMCTLVVDVAAYGRNEDLDAPVLVAIPEVGGELEVHLPVWQFLQHRETARNLDDLRINGSVD